MVPASRLGLAADETAAGLWDEWDVPVERVGFLVPEGARTDGDVGLDEVLALAPGDAAGVEEASVGNDAVVGLFQRPGEFLPAELYVPGEFYVPDAFYLPDGFTTPDGFDRGGVLYVDDGPRAASLFGRTSLPGRALDAGESVDLANVLLAAPGDAVFDGGDAFDAEAVFDLGEPAPLGGREFGFATLSTPDATVEGTDVNPLTDATVREALAHDHVDRTARELGITAADAVEWLRGPVELEPTWHEPSERSLLGEPVAVTAFGGVVSGVDGPRAVVLHAASSDDGDRVLAWGASARPVGTPDGRESLVGEDGFVGRVRFTRAARVAAAAMPSVERPSD